jgi:hypothetical protein
VRDTPSSSPKTLHPTETHTSHPKRTPESERQVGWRTSSERREGINVRNTSLWTVPLIKRLMLLAACGAFAGSSSLCVPEGVRVSGNACWGQKPAALSLSLSPSLSSEAQAGDKWIGKLRATSGPNPEPRSPNIEFIGCQSVREWSSFLGLRTVVRG